MLSAKARRYPTLDAVDERMLRDVRQRVARIAGAGAAWQVVDDTRFASACENRLMEDPVP
jgi:hypothetical protein